MPTTRNDEERERRENVRIQHDEWRTMLNEDMEIRPNPIHRRFMEEYAAQLYDDNDDDDDDEEMSIRYIVATNNIKLPKYTNPNKEQESIKKRITMASEILKRKWPSIKLIPTTFRMGSMVEVKTQITLSNNTAEKDTQEIYREAKIILDEITQEYDRYN